MKKSSVKQTLILSIVLAFLLSAIILFWYSQKAFVSSLTDVQNTVLSETETSGALITYPASFIQDKDSVLLLAGTWEYYPDVLLFSEHVSADVRPSLITVPVDTLSQDAAVLSRTGKGSFRVRLTDVPDMGENNLCIFLYNLLADYKIYVNGTLLEHRLLPPPNSHQSYSVNASGDLEIVIEVSKGLNGLNVVPQFGYVRIPMSTSDNLRNFSLLLMAIFAVVFIMFLIFFSSASDRKMRPVFFYGLMLTATYVINMLWALGQDSSIEQLVPFSALRPMILTLELLMILMAFWLFYREYRSDALKKLFRLEALLMAGAWICMMISVSFFLSVTLQVIGIAFLIFAIAVWIFTLYKTIVRYHADSLVLSIVLLLVLTAVVMNMMQWHISIRGGIFYILPASIGIYLIYCFYKYQQYKRVQMQKMEVLLVTEKQASRTQAALLASQIQPHFLYNTLLTIQNFCKTDPDQASRLIVKFSNYLRHNIDFMNYTELVPFAKELEHIENFIEIQKARFREKLNYETSIDYQDFEIPPLTVQPIVENAVKYGIRNSLTGGTVLLKVLKDAAFIHIIVSNDTGPSFDPATAKLRSLDNIQKRLESLLNASLEIRSAGKEGTVVEIIFLEKKE